jgi:hypothetical protein
MRGRRPQRSLDPTAGRCPITVKPTSRRIVATIGFATASVMSVVCLTTAAPTRDTAPRRRSPAASHRLDRWRPTPASTPGSPRPGSPCSSPARLPGCGCARHRLRGTPGRSDTAAPDRDGPRNRPASSGCATATHANPSRDACTTPSVSRPTHKLLTAPPPHRLPRTARGRRPSRSSPHHREPDRGSLSPVKHDGRAVSTGERNRVHRTWKLASSCGTARTGPHGLLVGGACRLIRCTVATIERLLFGVGRCGLGRQPLVCRAPQLPS